MSRRFRSFSRLMAFAALTGGLAVALCACDRSMQDAAQAYSKGDYAKAYVIYSKAAKEGDPDAQFTLGLMYFEGTGTEKDFAEAARWYRRAAAQGQIMAQNNLAAMLMEGKGVTRDPAEAAFWFSLVANAGDPHARMLRDRAAASLTSVEQDGVRQKAAAFKPVKEKTN